jgi:4-amino-4-deoxy-L-arabinose transferase-like glycosyltransferase
MEAKTAPGRASLWVVLIILLGLGIRMAGLYWGQGYCLIGPSDALEAYSVIVDYGRGEPKAEYLGQPNYNSHAKLPGPLWTLFGFIGLQLWGSIEGVVLGLILVNTVAIYFTYLLAERILGPPASLWAALLAATLPFSVYYSVSVYNPNVMPFFGGLLFLALWNVIRRERSRSVFWVVFLLLVMPQFHMCVTMLLPALILILLLAAPRLNLPWLLGGLFAGAMLYVPYLRGDMSHGWQNTLGMVSVRSGYSLGGFKALTAPLSILTNWVPQWTRSAAEYYQLGKACFGWFGIFLALNLLSALMALLLVGRALVDIKIALAGFWRGPRAVFSRSPGLLFLAILVAVPLFCATVSGKNFRTHYSLVLFPAMLALAGGAVAKWSSAPRLGRYFTATMVLLTCANAWFMPALFHDQGVRIARGEVFIGSFRKLESVYQQLKGHAGANRQVIVEDEAYFQRFSRLEQERLSAKFIRPYVAIREKESAPRSGGLSEPVIYRLSRSEDAPPDDTRVAYRAHGIALISVGND